MWYCGSWLRPEDEWIKYAGEKRVKEGGWKKEGREKRMILIFIFMKGWLWQLEYALNKNDINRKYLAGNNKDYLGSVYKIKYGWLKP